MFPARAENTVHPRNTRLSSSNSTKRGESGGRREEEREKRSDAEGAQESRERTAHEGSCLLGNFGVWGWTLSVKGHVSPRETLVCVLRGTHTGIQRERKREVGCAQQGGDSASPSLRCSDQELRRGSCPIKGQNR